MKKIAIIGFGFMGITHAQAILKNKNLKLVAVIDPGIDAVKVGLKQLTEDLDNKQIIEKIDSITHYTSLESCLDDQELDAVHICVHTNLHYPLVKKALENKLHVLVEKPFCFDLDQGDELINLSKNQNCQLMVAHVVRFMQPYQQLKKWVKDESYGKLKFLSMSRFSGVPQWGQWKEKQADFGSSGGALFDLLIHDVDFVLDVMGNSPQEMGSVLRAGRLSKHDYINTLWYYPEKDVTVKLEGGNTFHVEFPFQAGFMAEFENASIQYSTQKAETIFVASDETLEELPAADLMEGYSNEIKYFYACIQNATQPINCTPESSLETIRICKKIADS